MPYLISQKLIIVNGFWSTVFVFLTKGENLVIWASRIIQISDTHTIIVSADSSRSTIHEQILWLICAGICVRATLLKHGHQPAGVDERRFSLFSVLDSQCKLVCIRDCFSHCLLVKALIPQHGHRPFRIHLLSPLSQIHMSAAVLWLYYSQFLKMHDTHLFLWPIFPSVPLPFWVMSTFSRTQPPFSSCRNLPWNNIYPFPGRIT